MCKDSRSDVNFTWDNQTGFKPIELNINLFWPKPKKESKMSSAEVEIYPCANLYCFQEAAVSDQRQAKMVWSFLRSRQFSLWRWGNPSTNIAHHPSLKLVHQLLSIVLFEMVWQYVYISVFYFAPNDVLIHFHLLFFRVLWERSPEFMGTIHFQRPSCQARWTLKWLFQRSKRQNRICMCWGFSMWELKYTFNLF